MTLCSEMSRVVGEPLAGSAPEARLWVLVEQSGPWGRDAVVESDLGLETGRALKEWSADQPVRLGLIRRPGRHPGDGTVSRPRTVLLARSDPDHSWLRAESMSDPRELLNLDPAQLLTLPADPRPHPRLLLVCTHSKRDQCCALKGRILAERLATTFDGDVWETSHLGGHRFAPTLVSLPDGYLYGGPDAETLSTRACRGRSTLSADGQVAEIAALEHFGLRSPRALEVTDRGSGHWLVRAPDGRSLTIAVTSSDSPVERQESCGKTPVGWRRRSAEVVG